MFEFVSVVSLIGIVVLFVRQSMLKKEINQLRAQLGIAPATPQQPTAQRTPTPVPVQTAPAETTHKAPPVPPVLPRGAVISPNVKTETMAAETKPVVPTPPPVARPTPTGPTPWDNFQKKFVENWTGILGSIVLVMGVGFLGIYAAIQLAPFFRFLLIDGFAALLLGLFFFMKRRPAWADLSSWLRSSAGAVFLFGCVGSSAIPGLKWIDNETAALALIGAGVGVNLLCGYLGGTQIFASLHVILSLIALGMAPQALTTMGAAGIVTAAGILFCYRSRWEAHLLLTIVAFFIYQIFWHNQLVKADSIPTDVRIVGIASTLLVGCLALFVHYRKMYEKKAFEALPFLTHVTNWLFMAVGFLLYSTGSKWNTIVLGVAALFIYTLSYRARKMEIRWLSITDKLTAQAVAVFALLTLHRWEVPWTFAALALSIEALIFIVLAVREGEPVLKWMGAAMNAVMSIVLIVICIDAIPQDGSSRLQPGLCLLIALLAQLALHFYSFRKQWFDSFNAPVSAWKVTSSGLIVGLLAPAAYLVWTGNAWLPWAGTAAAVTLFFVAARLRSDGLGIALLIFVTGALIENAAYGVDKHAKDALASALYSIPGILMPIAAAVLLRFRGRNTPVFGIYGSAAYAYFLVQLHTESISPFLPGLICIVLSVFVVELALFLGRGTKEESEARGEPDWYLLHTGVVFAGLFVIWHMTVHLQSEIFFGFVRLRLLLALAGLVGLLHWALLRFSAAQLRYAFVRYLQPLFWEISIGFAVFTTAVELPTQWHPVAWMIFALVLWIAAKKVTELSRFRLYAVLMHLATAFHLAFVATTFITPSSLLTDQAWFGGLLGLLLQIGMIVLLHRMPGADAAEFPPALAFIRPILNVISNRRYVWMYYPVFIGSALFLYWTFDHALLTLLWVVEAFVVFSLSLFLKESHFRYVAMTGLVACLARLIFFDMAQAGTLSRALVFLGTGAIMIAINALYNKFKERL